MIFACCCRMMVTTSTGRPVWSNSKMSSFIKNRKMANHSLWCFPIGFCRGFSEYITRFWPFLLSKPMAISPLLSISWERIFSISISNEMLILLANFATFSPDVFIGISHHKQFLYSIKNNKNRMLCTINNFWRGWIIFLQDRRRAFLFVC